MADVHGTVTGVAGLLPLGERRQPVLGAARWFPSVVVLLLFCFESSFIRHVVVK